MVTQRHRRRSAWVREVREVREVRGVREVREVRGVREVRYMRGIFIYSLPAAPQSNYVVKRAVKYVFGSNRLKARQEVQRRATLYSWPPSPAGPVHMGQSTARDLMCEGVLHLSLDVVRMIRAFVHDEIILSIPKDSLDEVTAAGSWGQCYAKEEH